MARLKENEAILSRGESFRVDPRKLQIEPGFNVRDLDAPTARARLDELKEQIRADGVQVPLEIRIKNDVLYVVSGHRRHKVVMELIEEGVDIASVPAIPEPKIISEAERTARLITLNAGEPLTSLEKAEVVRRLYGYGWTRERIAVKLGFRTPQQVANYEKLLSAPEEVREAVRAGELSASNAVEIVRAHGDDAGEKLEEARVTAKATGKKRITKKSMAPTAPKGRRSAAEIEVANLRLLQEADKAEDRGPNNLADMDRAIALLASLSERGMTARRLAECYDLRQVRRVYEASDFLYEFAEALRDRESDAADKPSSELKLPGLPAQAPPSA